MEFWVVKLYNFAFKM